MAANSVLKNYLLLTFLNALAGSLIWGINTLFLLDAGLTNTEAFAANAFYTLGMVLFEIPTGVVADTVGRRASFLLGSITLVIGTALYFLLWKYKLGFTSWAVVSVALGLGYTFFSGAVEAWLVDALNATGFTGTLESVFAKGQVANGTAMLSGALIGGYLAQVTDLGVPYIVRCGLLLLSFGTAFIVMRDLGFQSRKAKSVTFEMKRIFKESVDGGLKKPSVRWIMLTSPFISVVVVYGFYAAQPFLLELYGDSTVYGLAGLAAALVASTQIIGGLLAPKFQTSFKKRSSAMGFFIFLGALALGSLGLVDNFLMALLILGFWGLVGAAMMPIKQAYLNHSIPSDKRATILSFDSLLGSTGGVVSQPLLGRSADIWGYSVSFLICGIVQLLALPFVLLAKKERSAADEM